MFRIDIVVAIFSVFLAVGLIKCVSDDSKEFVLIKRYQMECIEETRVDAEVIAKIKKENWSIPREQIHLVKDWALCALMKTGLMTRQGVYKIDLALSKVPQKDRNNVEMLIDKCLSTKAIPAPDIAMEFVKCYQRAKGNYTHTVSILF